jgi:hypothetical protein
MPITLLVATARKTVEVFMPGWSIQSSLSQQTDSRYVMGLLLGSRRNESSHKST